MRKIKFKALVEYYDYAEDGTTHCKKIVWEYYSTFEKPIWLVTADNIIVKDLQYTGLKDKNNKEIYEGDIVKDNYGQKREIIFIDGEFKITCGCYDFLKKKLSTELICFAKEREVIGNVHQNPEIIGGKN